MTPVPREIINSVRNQHALGPRRKVVIEGYGGLRAPAAALAKQSAQELFRLRIHGKDRVASRFITSTFALLSALCWWIGVEEWGPEPDL